MLNDDYYQVGGSLEYQHPTYVERQADHELYRNLKNGNYCYILNSRQMGKSSLRVQVMKKLKQEDIKCASIDITGIGSNVTSVEWYGAIVSELLRGFRLTRKVDFKIWWRQREILSPVQRFKEFIEDVLLKEFSQDIVIFIDEIDSVLKVPFKDDFFAFIRACYNYRVDNPDYKRLTFCLLGVATPANLIQNRDRTPFNIGQAIELTGFNLEQAKPSLTPGLVDYAEDPEQVLAEILAWTGGQPFLTQKVCRLVQLLSTPMTRGSEQQSIEQLVRHHIVDNWEAQDEPEHLRTIRDRILKNQQQAGQLLGLYQQVLQRDQAQSYKKQTQKLLEIVDLSDEINENENINGNRSDNLKNDTNNAVDKAYPDFQVNSSSEQMELRLTGLVVKHQGQLQVYNRIYAEVFNTRWIEQMLAELRPYAAALTAWIESNEQDETCLLQGQLLLNAQLWAANKNLSTQDYRFLAASQELAKQEVQAILDQEKKAAQILAAANQKATQRIRIGSAILALCLGLAVITGTMAAIASYKQREARTGTRLEQAGISALQQFESQQIEALLSVMQTGRELKALAGDRRLQQYPATSPLFALQYILDQIREKNQLPGHQGRVLGVAFSPDGKQFATVGQDQIVRLWSRDQRLVTKLKGHEGWVRSISFSPDSRLLATAGFDGARLWDRSGKQIAQFMGHRGAVMGIAFDPNSKFVATVGQDRTIRFWDLTGQPLKVWQGHKSEIHALSFSPDGSLLATAGLDGVRIWNRDGKPVNVFHKSQRWVSSLSFRPDGQLLAIAGSEGASLWTRSGQKVADFKRHQGKVNQIRFSPDGLVLATVGDDGILRLWNDQGEQIAEFKGHQGRVNSVDFSSDGLVLATAGNDGTLRLWERFRLPLREFGGKQNEIYSVRFSPDGNMLATAGQNRTVRLWSRRGKPIAVFAGLQGRALSLSFSPDRQLLAAGGFEETVRIWRLDGQLVRELKGHEGGTFSVSFSPDGQLIAVGSEGMARIWKLDGTLLRELKVQEGRVKSVGFSPDGELIVTAASNGTVQVWNKVGKQISELKNPGAVYSVQFSPDDNLLATSGLEGTVRLWNQNGQLLRELKGHAGAVHQVDFSPDGQLIATAGADGTVRLWNRTGTLLAEYQLAEYQNETGEIYSISFSADGRSLATAGTDGMVRLWAVEDLDQLLQHGCEWLKEYLQTHPDVPKVCPK